MAISSSLLSRLSVIEQKYILSSAQKAQDLEREWLKKFEKHLQELDDKVFRSLVDHGRFKTIGEIDFLPLILEHSVRVMETSMKDAQKTPAQISAHELASPPKGKMPRSLRILKELWDEWKKKRNLPPRQKAMAERIRRAYIKRVQSVWEKYGEEFREGDSYSPEKVRKVLRDHGDMAHSRVKTVVQTETTYYYNRARRMLYDQSPDVTHYLFVALRDQATTKWCKSRQGIVYAKGDPLLEEETPPIHYNCRSEILPLTPQNPRHLKLIEDKSKARRHNHCEPLPKDWKRR